MNTGTSAHVFGILELLGPKNLEIWNLEFWNC